MAKTQWHPAFAELLKLLLRDYYEIETEVPVSELPRAGDVLLIRKQGSPSPPFKHLWSYLREWNVIEFKGMTDHAEVSDLELLIHVCTGVTHKLNERRREAKQPALRNFDVAFWYVAPTIGEAIREAVQGKSRLSYEAEGIWRAEAWGHPVYLVSVRDLPHTIDSLPLLLLREPAETSLASLFAGNRELVERMARWLFVNRPKLWQEVRIVADGLKVDWDEVVKSPDADDVVRAMPVDRVVRVLGPEKAIDEALAQLTPERAEQLLRSKLKKPDAPVQEGGAE